VLKSVRRSAQSLGDAMNHVCVRDKVFLRAQSLMPSRDHLRASYVDAINPQIAA